MDKRLLTVIKKELKRIFTDRRLVFTTMILPAVSIFLMYSLLGNMISDKDTDVDANIPRVVVVSGADTFRTYSEDMKLDQVYDLTWEEDTSQVESLKDQIYDGELDVLLVFDKDFDQDVKAMAMPNLVRYYNRVEDYSNEARYRIDEDLAQYETYLLGIRMGNPDHVEVFQINRDLGEGSLHNSQKEIGKGLSMLFPMLIAMFLFTGAMSVGPDMIAGEKERGTMATLLVTPVKREVLAMGKVIALVIVALITAGSSFIGVMASMPSASKMFESNGFSMASLKFGAREYLYLAAIMLTLVLLYVSIVCLISIISKTIKEANTYMSPVYMIVTISGFSTMYMDGAISNTRFMIPVYGSIVAIKKLFAFEITSNMVLYTCGTSIILSGVLIYMIKVLFNNEKVMFSK